MPLMQIDNVVVTILRDAVLGDHGFDKRYVGKQVHVLLPDNSTRIVPLADITVDGVRQTAQEVVVVPRPVPLAPIPDVKPVDKEE